MEIRKLMIITVGIVMLAGSVEASSWWNHSYNLRYIIPVNASESQNRHFVCMNISMINGSIGDLALLRNDSGTWNHETWWWKGDRKVSTMEWYVNDSICWRVNLSADETKNWYIYSSSNQLGQQNSSGLLYRDSGENDASWTDAGYMSQESGGLDGDYFLRFSGASGETIDYMTFPEVYDDEDLYACFYARLTDNARFDNYYYLTNTAGGTSNAIRLSYVSSGYFTYADDAGSTTIDNSYEGDGWIPICLKGVNTTGSDAIVAQVTNSTHEVALSNAGSLGTVIQLTSFTLKVGGGGSGAAQQDLDSFIILDGYDFNLYLIQPTISLGGEESSPNESPTGPDSMSPPNNTFNVTHNVILNCSGSTDADGDPITYYYYADTVDGSTLLGSSSGEYNWTDIAGGTYLWKCRAYDGFNYSDYNETYTLRVNSLPTASVSITPLSPRPDETLTCIYSTPTDGDGDSVSFIRYDWRDGSSWLDINSSTLDSSYTLNGGSYSCSVTLNDGYENNTLVSGDITVGFGCISSIAYSLNMTSTVNLLLINFSSITHLVNPNMTNVITLNNASIYDDYSLLFNTTLDSSILFYIGGDSLSESYDTISATPDDTISIRESNLTVVNTLYRISLLDGNGNVWNITEENKSVTLQVFCSVYGYSEMSMTNETMKVPLKEAPSRLAAEVPYDDGTYTRSMIVSGSAVNITLYLIDVREHTPVYMTFELQDLSKEFTDPWIEWRRYVSSELQTISSDWFEIGNEVHVYLINNEKYRIYIATEGQSREIGWLTINSLDTTKTITISGIDEVTENIWGNVSLAWLTNYTQKKIGLTYADSANQTNSVRLMIYDYLNGSLLYEGEGGNMSSITYIVGDENRTYLMKANISHSIYGETLLQTIIGLHNISKRMIDFGLNGSLLGMSEDKWYKTASIVTIAGAGMLFGAYHAAIGAVIVALLASFFSLIGWLSLPAPLLAIILVLALLTALSKRRVVT